MDMASLHQQQHQQSRYYTLGGQSNASLARPSTLQRRMMNTSHQSAPEVSSASNNNDDGGSTPICRCRVLYLGSAVPQVTKDGLQGIQEPLRELYPEGGAMGAKGIDSWLSVWSNGLLLENVDENHQRVTRFFPIDSLHYCAAVRYVLVPSTSPNASQQHSPSSGGGGVSSERIARFLPLDSPFARHPNIHHPPLFACIMRRTTGIKVLECHVFICKRETAANALVRCCFHAYADSTYAHHLEEEEGNNKNGSGGALTGPAADLALNSIEKVETWKLYQQQQQNGRGNAGKVDESAEKEGSTSSHGMGSASVSMLILDHGSADEDNGSSIINGEQNHKIWLPAPGTGSKSSRRLGPTGPVASVSAISSKRPTQPEMYGNSTLRSIRSSISAAMQPRRPRQIPPPNVAPPPPPPVMFLPSVDESDGKTNKKNKKKRGSEVDDMSSVVTGPISGQRRSSNSIFNFPIQHPGRMGPLHPPPPAGYPMSYPFFPGRGGPGPAGPPAPPPGAILVPMPLPANGINGKKSKKFGTFSARGINKKALKNSAKAAAKAAQQHGGVPPPGMMFIPPPPPVMAPPMALGLPVPMMAPPLSMRRMSMSAEEPIYMPSQVRPLSPIASYAPAHFPHEAYLMQQHYGAMQPPPGLIPGGPMMTPMATLTKQKKDKKSSKNKDKDQSHLVMMDGMSDLHDEEVSLTSQTGGIYRKGHINERAFSYSIRQEHRSRSYSSLAGVGASAYPGGPEDLRAHDKKERELIQMVHDLDLSGDDLERSEVPLAMYPGHHRQPR